jgi:hypothetical protein
VLRLSIDGLVALVVVATVGIWVTRRQPVKPVARPEITSTEGDGFHDLVFAIAGRTRDADGQRLDVVGTFRGKDVGLAIDLLGPLNSRNPKTPDLGIRTGQVRFRSTGAQSDEMLRALDVIYGTGLNPTHMAPTTTFAGISLEGNPGDLERGTVKIKLFFESEDQARYAEAYVDIDVAEGSLQFNEKDQEYRKALVRALSGM